MENVLGALIVAINVIFACILAVAAFSGADAGINETKSAIAEAQKAVSVEDVDFARVKSGSISGTEAVQLLQKFDDSGYGHLVVTSGKPDGFYSADGVTDIHSDYYVKPDKMFSGSVVANQNGIVYGVRFIEEGMENVEFDRKKAAAEPESMNRQVKEAQYKLFSKFLIHRGKCSQYMQLCSRWGKALKQLDDAQMRSIFTKYSKDSANQEEYMSAQVIAFDLQAKFYDAVSEQVKLWTENKWWEAILSADLDNSSEDLNPGSPGDNGDDDSPWWADPGNSDSDSSVDDSDSDSDSENHDGSNTGDDVEVIITPDPSVSVEPDASAGPVPSVEPGVSEEPVVTEEPVTTEEPVVTEEPVATEEPAVTEEPRATDGGTVPITGPDLT